MNLNYKFNFTQFEKPKIQMQNLIARMNKVDIRDKRHITTMDENVIWMELTHILLKKSLTLSYIRYL
jgi:hypothetical protein